MSPEQQYAEAILTDLTTKSSQVERSPRLGRYLVAKVDIPAGTLILNELPLVVGPRMLTKPVCLGCHKELKQGKGSGGTTG